MSARKGTRRTSRLRRTKETGIRIGVQLDGSGECRARIPDGFLRHMVETLAKYSGADIDIEAKGDMAHHLIEDVAIALGRGFREAMKGRPVRRIASATVPMDEALVTVAVDLIDRPFVHIEVPDVMYEHFIRSFAMELRATVHTLVIRGRDQHHIIEATFKALGIALKEAMTPVQSLVSTKSDVRWRKKR